jgi:hypothetical protein
MNLQFGSRTMLRTSVLSVAFVAITAFAWGQHKEESKGSGHENKPSHSAPASRGASHAPAPSRAPSRSAGPNRQSEGRSAQRPSGTPGNRPGNPRGNGGNTPGNRPGNAGGNRGNTPGNRPGNAGANRPGNGGNRPGNAGGNRPGNAGGNRPGNVSGDRGGRNAAGGRAGASMRPAPGRTVSLRGGGTASIRPNGQIRSINRNGVQVRTNLHGGRTVVTERNGTRIVSNGRNAGYVQRSYVTRGGASYYSRTYYNHGVYSVGIYRGYNYGGFHYYGYYPGYWYHPGFYGWAYRPWGPPVYWGIGVGGWGWGGAPWFGFYGGYFAPYPVYPSAAFWLTDYVIAAELQDAYAARQAAYADTGSGYDQGSANSGNYSDQGGAPANTATNSEPVTLTPEVKEAIAEEVKAQLAQQQQQAGTLNGGDAQAAPAPTGDQVPPALDPARRTFVVDNGLTVISDGQECELTGGDVITRLTDTPDADQKVTASVSASKKSDCIPGSQILVSVDDLQEMHNHFEEQLNNGLKSLAEKQGTGGLPKAPDAGTVSSDVPPPQPDQNAAKDLSEAQSEADQTESQVKQEAGSGGGQQ